VLTPSPQNFGPEERPDAFASETIALLERMSRTVLKKGV